MFDFLRRKKGIVSQEEEYANFPIRFRGYGDAGKSFLNADEDSTEEDLFIASLLIHLYAAVILKSDEFEKNLLPVYYFSAYDERIKQYRSDFVSYAENQKIDVHSFLSSHFASTQFFKDNFDQSIIGQIKEYGKTNGYALYSALYQDDCLIELEAFLGEEKSSNSDSKYFEASKAINYLVLGDEESALIDNKARGLKSTIFFIKILYLDDSTKGK